MELSGLYVREGRAISKAQGALIIAEAIPGIMYNEIVDVVLSNGEVKSGQAIDIRVADVDDPLWDMDEIERYEERQRAAAARAEEKARIAEENRKRRERRAEQRAAAKAKTPADGSGGK